MKQRVMIAIALACTPKLLIADEPTTALDVTIQAQVLELMNKLKQEFGTAMLLITHDLGVVAEVCDSVAIIYAGEIVERGSLSQVYGGVCHPYTQGLFDSLPDLDEESERLKTIQGMMPDPSDLPGAASSIRAVQTVRTSVRPRTRQLWRWSRGIRSSAGWRRKEGEP